MSPPKAILFDIGGVCVVSPFQAIVDYEARKNIPNDWVNFAISRSSPNGSWQRLERGEIKLDDDFFEGFRSDLHNPRLWEQYHMAFKGRRNAQDEVSNSVQVMNTSSAIPPLPNIDSTTLFWSMMSISRTPDQHMFPALLNLRSLSRFTIGALSNTITFPSSHPYAQPPKDPKDDVRSQFDVFIGSADVGLRKPAIEIYELAVKKLDEFDRRKGGSGILASDIVFLDDIGENLRTAKSVGMRTIKVNLGQTQQAVEELEKVVGADLSKKTKEKL